MQSDDSSPEARRPLGLWATWLVISLTGFAIAAVIHYNARTERLGEADARLDTELAYLQHVIGSALQAGEFQQVRDFVSAWGEFNGQTLRLELVAANGFELGGYRRAVVATHTHSARVDISFSYRGQATLTLQKNLDPVYRGIADLGWQLLGAATAISLLGLTGVLQLQRYRGQVALAHNEYRQRVNAQSALEKMATIDALTGMPNRHMLDDQLALRLAEAARFDRQLALLFIDLDNFKTVNDTFGHAAGDQLLCTVSTRIRHCLRAYDLLARFGGDEFVVLLSSIGVADAADNVARKILAALEPRIRIGENDLFVSCSIGVALYPDDSTTPGDLLRTADAAMYAAKSEGKNCHRFFTAAMNDSVTRRQRLEHGLHDALEDGSLYLVYQPQVALNDGRVVACEGLLRWRSGAVEIPPGDFIPIAEQSALIRRIQAFVIETAARQRAAWKRRGIGVRIDINVSGGSLLLDELIPSLANALQTHGLTPADIGIELTERALVEASAQAIDGLAELRRRGCVVSIDDFGTGYSSLAYLKTLPVDVLKIDRAFVRDLPDSRMDGAIVQAIIAMAHSMGKQTLAECVETPAQLAYVAAQGCDLAQGFHLERPLPAEALEPLLRRGLPRSAALASG